MNTGDILVLCLLLTPGAALAAATIAETISLHMIKSEPKRDDTEG